MKSKIILSLIILLISACTQPTKKTLLVLHTNDTHSQVEPLSPGTKNGNMAGYARRNTLIDSIRKQGNEIVLVDAGDFSQGTPYYNFYHGRIEVEAMNSMMYDVVTLGNHEFDYGIDTLAAVLANAQFKIVCCLVETTLDSFIEMLTTHTANGINIIHLHIQQTQTREHHHCTNYPNSHLFHIANISELYIQS